jgi:hypothetical protein
MRLGIDRRRRSIESDGSHLGNPPYNFFEVEHYKVQSPAMLPRGKSTITLDVKPVESGFGKPRTVTMSVNGEVVAEGRIEKSVPVRYSLETFDIGMDLFSPVSGDYTSPNKFTGKIHQVTVELK